MALLKENLFMDGLDQHLVEGLDSLASESSEGLLSEFPKLPDFIKGTVLITFADDERVFFVNVIPCHFAKRSGSAN